MAYAEITVICDGALEAHVQYSTEQAVERYVTMVERDARVHSLRLEVFVLWHQHGELWGSCECRQYVTDSRPTRVFDYRPESE